MSMNEPNDGANMESPKLASGVLSRRSDVAETLAAELRKTRPFPSGTIIAWTSRSSNGVDYSYAAVFANGSWYTTVERPNPYISPKMSHAEMLAYLADRGDYIVDLRVATDFEAVEL